jgi:hypothetical protein
MPYANDFVEDKLAHRHLVWAVVTHALHHVLCVKKTPSELTTGAGAGGGGSVGRGKLGWLASACLGVLELEALSFGFVFGRFLGPFVGRIDGGGILAYAEPQPVGVSVSLPQDMARPHCDPRL